MESSWRTLLSIDAGEHLERSPNTILKFLESGAPENSPKKSRKSNTLSETFFVHMYLLFSKKFYDSDNF